MILYGSYVFDNQPENRSGGWELGSRIVGSIPFVVDQIFQLVY